MADKSIVVDGLAKNYGDFWALNGISFDVEPGEIVGFLGPNGAGKTTTMKILTCFMAASKGTAKVAGHDVYDESEKVRKKIGYLPENVPLYEEMMVYDYLKFIAEIRGVPSDRRRERIKKVVQLTGLEGMITRDIRELSKGYRQRVGLAQSIIHEPEVVILDEPTSGLDPNQIIDIRDLITEIGREKTVIFSTHILQEVAAVCDRIVVIDHGEIVADGTVEELAARVTDRDSGLLVTAPTAAATRSSLAKLPGVKAVEEIHVMNGHTQFRLDCRDVEVARTALFAGAAQLQVTEVTQHQPSLEDIFRALTSGEGVVVSEDKAATKKSASSYAPPADDEKPPQETTSVVGRPAVDEEKEAKEEEE